MDMILELMLKKQFQNRKFENYIKNKSNLIQTQHRKGLESND